jgi:hypothetical protein
MIVEGHVADIIKIILTVRLHATNINLHYKFIRKLTVKNDGKILLVLGKHIFIEKCNKAACKN